MGDPTSTSPASNVADAPPRVLTDALKADIRAAYTKLQANTPGFSTRRSQSAMIGLVSRALATSGGIGVAEAPTGVGKSLAYLTAGVPIALATKKTLVISTGTVALQSQLVERDIPAFLAATGLDAKVALAKGRTRYLCTRNAAELQAEHSQGTMLLEGVGPDEGGDYERQLYDRPLAPHEVDAARRLLEAHADRQWDGDIDAAPEPISSTLRTRITTPASGCAGRRCGFAQQCPVLKVRTTVREAQIVVTNHALLLSSLAMGDLENGQPLLAPPGEMLLVLDEGHHVANVAIDQGAARLPLADMAKRTSRLQILIAGSHRLVDKERIGTLLPNEAIELAARVSKGLKAFQLDVDRVWQPEPGDRDPMWRAPLGRLPDDWTHAIETLGEDTRALLNWVHAAQQAVARTKQEDPGREKLQRSLGMAREMIEQQHDLWAGWRREDREGAPPMARWITVTREGDLTLHCSPVSAAQVLRTLLWKEIDSVVMTSATLSGGGDFQSFAIDTGLPDHAETASLPSPFDLPNQAQLVVPQFPVAPDDREGHPKAVAEWLARELDWTKGSMVLFTSRWKMEKVAELMPASRRGAIQVQSSGNKSQVVAAHLERVAAGKGSVLFGLNSFGEGLDLPGEACTTVVITQVPFAVPTDPQTATLGEWLQARGQNPFNLIAIPHALRTLTQFAGRLIRTSTDTGRVVILDSRLLNRRYGKRILDALPPFKRVIG